MLIPVLMGIVGLLSGFIVGFWIVGVILTSIGYKETRALKEKMNALYGKFGKRDD